MSLREVKVEIELTVEGGDSVHAADPGPWLDHPGHSQEPPEQPPEPPEPFMVVFPQPEFVSVKVEPKDEEEGSGEETLPSEQMSYYAANIVAPELVPDFEISVKQEPLDENGMDYPFQEPLAPGQVPTTSSFYSEKQPSNVNSTPIKFQCQQCIKQFANKSNLQRHMLIHSKRKIECDLCCRPFLSKDQLQKHIRNTHCTEKVFECTDCNKTFRSSSNLVQHKRIHTGDKPFRCQVCNRGFAVKANMLKHQGRSRCKDPDAEPLICTVCNKVFQREFLLKSHLRMHTTEKPFECATCAMHFKYKSTLIRHIQLHNGDRPHSCKICGKTFTHSGLIKPHMRRHTGEKPYICPICQKRFSHKHNMQRHTLRHNKIKHLVCEVCHKGFPKESRLKYHMRTHMDDKRPFKCEYCPKSFSHRQNIQRHYKKKHPTKIYDRPETDASIASIIWQTVLKKKMEAEKDYILPEQEWPEDAKTAAIKQEKEE